MKSELLLCAATLLFVACDQKTQIKCSEGCEQFGAVCDSASGLCVKSNGDLGDGSVIDMPETDIAAPDLIQPDLLPPPDLMPECTNATVATACGTSEPICSSAGTCVACSSAADDAVCMARDVAKGHCELAGGPNLGQCVECAASSQCPSAKPVCELAATGATRNTCRACSAHAECGADKLCDKGDIPSSTTIGQCVTPVIVDKTVDCKTTGTEAKPWCQIHQALGGEAAAAGPLFVLVKGPAAEYDNFTIDSTTPNKKLVIVGQTGGAQPIINATGVVGININFVAAATVNAVIENFEIGKSSGGVRLNGAGVSCTGTNATVAVMVRNSTIAGVLSGPGVLATSCAVSLLQSTLLLNEGGGVDVTGTNPTLSIVNTVIAANGKVDPSGSNVGGVRINAGTAKIVNTTIVDSRTKAGRYTGVDGDSADSVIGLNVLVAGGQGSTTDIRSATLGNSAFAAGTTPSDGNKDISTCALSDILTDPSASIYTPKVGATATCTVIDAGGSSFMTLTAPSTDRAGTSRPAGGVMDIGAYESP